MIIKHTYYQEIIYR
ncbi:hypothetical protein CP02DC14_1228A, partial [Chlamydia psittaci 02DC14]